MKNRDKCQGKTAITNYKLRITNGKDEQLKKTNIECPMSNFEVSFFMGGVASTHYAIRHGLRNKKG